MVSVSSSICLPRGAATGMAGLRVVEDEDRIVRRVGSLQTSGHFAGVQWDETNTNARGQFSFSRDGGMGVREIRRGV